MKWLLVNLWSSKSILSNEITTNFLNPQFVKMYLGLTIKHYILRLFRIFLTFFILEIKDIPTKCAYQCAISMTHASEDSMGLGSGMGVISTMMRHPSHNANVNTLRLVKMVANFLKTFSNAFFGMKMYEFQLRFHWSLFLRVHLIIFQHWFR